MSLLSKLRELPPQERGRRFEEFVRRYLPEDPEWGVRLRDIRPAPGRDVGVDLEAIDAGDGSRWAIQVKYHDSPLGYGEIATFLHQCATRYAHGLLVTASSPTSEAERQMAASGVELLTLRDIEDVIDETSFDWDTPTVFVKREISLRPYQREAVEAVVATLGERDRCRLVMPPGAGKTLVALRVAEALDARRVLVLVPRVGLLDQTARRWANDAEVPKLWLLGVTADATVGQGEDGDSEPVLRVPASTSAEELAAAAARAPEDSMLVVCSTYHSTQVVIDAQERWGLGEFDLVVADEAHRTTGQQLGQPKAFQLVHSERLRARRRLYMTATPRVYKDSVREAARERGVEVVSMDDEDTYGPEAYRYGFGRAVEEGYLADYKVLVLCVDEARVQRVLAGYLERPESPTLEDAIQIVGTYKALCGEGEVPRLRRALAFTRRVRDSKEFAARAAQVVKEYLQATGGDHPRLVVKHMDAKTPAAQREEMLEWLREDPGEELRVVSNVGVLTEGIDVPALDAVVFLQPRRSQVDVVQAVGRAMRIAPGKRYGYIVLPVVVDPEGDVEGQLRGTAWEAVWEVLAALRSVDERFDALVRELWIRQGRGLPPSADDRVLVLGDVPEQPRLPLEFGQRLVARVVERVGDRRYFEQWAEDVAETAKRIVRQLGRHPELVGTLRAALGEVTQTEVSDEDAKLFFAQYVITGPVFREVVGEFGDDPVTRGLERLEAELKDFLEGERRNLEGFYRGVHLRARGMAPEQRQDFLRELYDSFFHKAFPETTERLGIAYTPVEIVRFLVRSVRWLLRERWGRELGDPSVVCLEPFAGTGTFLVELVREMGERSEEAVRERALWGNELLLLPYYIARANVEIALKEVVGRRVPFNAMLLADTFTIDRERGKLSLFPQDYGEALEAQRRARIDVIVSNPPWSSGRDDANTSNLRTPYPEVEARVRETYVARSRVQNRNSLYDSYLLALRWATDRVERGVVAMVTNSGWLRGLAAAGVRACLEEEYAELYVLDLRGDARTRGEAWKREGGKVFGQSSRAGVCLLVGVRDPEAQRGRAELLYADVGDYLTRDEKLRRLEEWEHVGGVPWRRLEPDERHNWLGQYSREFELLPPLGDKRGRERALWRVYSQGLHSGRDAWVWGHTREEVVERAGRLVEAYSRELPRLRGLSEKQAEAQKTSDPRQIAWARELLRLAVRGVELRVEDGKVMRGMYRPFVPMWVYFDRALNEQIYQLPKLWPEPGLPNVAIGVSGKGRTGGFAALVVDRVPCHDCLPHAQYFPLYRYSEGELLGGDVVEAPSGRRYLRDWGLGEWVLAETDLAPEELFWAVYAALSHPEYGRRYAFELSQDLPRLRPPRGEIGRELSRLGRALGELHLGFERVPPWELRLEGELEVGRVRKPQREGDAIHLGESARLVGLPEECGRWRLGDRWALAWAVEALALRLDKDSGIVWDPWRLGEEELLGRIARLVRVEVETVRLLEELGRLDISEVCG